MDMRAAQILPSAQTPQEGVRSIDQGMKRWVHQKLEILKLAELSSKYSTVLLLFRVFTHCVLIVVNLIWKDNTNVEFLL